MVPAVWQAVVGGARPWTAGTLPDYACRCLSGVPYPGLVASHGQCTQGVLYARLTPSDLQRLDRYEGIDYRRIRVSVRRDGGAPVTAWTYLTAPRAENRLTTRTWSLDDFMRHGLAACLRELEASL